MAQPAGVFYSGPRLKDEKAPLPQSIEDKNIYRKSIYLSAMRAAGSRSAREMLALGGGTLGGFGWSSASALHSDARRWRRLGMRIGYYWGGRILGR
jgi:hypothetical protein